MKCEQLQEEKKKFMEISIEDKMGSEETINRLQLKSNSDEKYIYEL